MTSRFYKAVTGFALGAALLSLPAQASCGKNLIARMATDVPASQAHARPTDAPEAASSAPALAVHGFWITSVILQGQTIYQAFESFTLDGLEFLNDNGSPLEGNVCFGVWTVMPDNTARVNHVSWNYDPNGNLIGTVVIKSQIALDPSANTFKGTVTVITYDLNGRVSGPEMQAQLVGKRITAS